MKINLGETRTDRISGFTGTVTGRCEYITGCVQYLLVPKVKESGSYAEAHWFDEDRLLNDSSHVGAATKGCDLQAPTK